MLPERWSATRGGRGSEGGDERYAKRERFDWMEVEAVEARQRLSRQA
jgi:hypothetical protein